MARAVWPALAILALLADRAGSLSSRAATSEPSRTSTQGENQGKSKPRLKLLADPQVGFTPLTTLLTGTLTGVAPDDVNFCHPAVTWLRVNPGQMEENASRYHQDSACRHPPEEAAATTTFTRYFDLYRPGPYLIKLVIEGKDGRRVESGYLQVQVLRVQ